MQGPQDSGTRLTLLGGSDFLDGGSCPGSGPTCEPGREREEGRRTGWCPLGQNLLVQLLQRTQVSPRWNYSEIRET